MVVSGPRKPGGREFVTSPIDRRSAVIDVGQRRRVCGHPILSTVQGAQELPQIRHEHEWDGKGKDPHRIADGLLGVP